MARKYSFLVFFLILIEKISTEEEGILCAANTCSTYISANPCATLSDKCKIQNSTHNGLFLPNPDPCNCCQFCLEHLNEGDYCAVGEIGGVIPSSICGPGLICSGSNEPVCVKKTEISNTKFPCSYQQAKYDKRRDDGTLGFLEIRPECDDDGFFETYKCVPGQSCFCLDKFGNRLFGDIPFKTTANLILKCGCPRKYNEILKFFDKGFLTPNQFFRCTETGDYDTIQCIGDKCMCTDALDGAPTYPTLASVNISNISAKTLSDCFDEKRHLTGKYYYSCAEKYLTILKQVEAYKKDGFLTVFEVEYPNCDLNGKYAPVQKGTRKTEDKANEIYYYCADSEGKQIGNYQESDSTKMDCKCARTTLLMTENGLENELPECCANGNFNRVQCRRGRCYCVDSDGAQDVNNTDQNKKIEVNLDAIEDLFCYNERCILV